MKILVTGGMGFIGSNFIRQMFFRHPSYSILNYDALTYAGNPDNLIDVEESDNGAGRYSFFKGDIVDADTLEKTVQSFQPDVIVNFAAESHVDRSLADSAEFINSNIVGAHKLFEISRKHNIKLVHISTDEVYGDVPEGYSSEESPIRPSNPYAASKAAADLLAQTYIRSHNAPILIVRGSNNYGPYQYPEKLIPLAITNILEGNKIPIHGNGKHIRTWIHVDDFSRGIDAVLHEGAIGSIYNISGHEQSNLELLRKIATHLEVSHDDFFEHVGDRPGADVRYAPISNKITQDLGWKPAHHIDEQITELVAWYKDNSEWWKKVKERKEFTDHYEKQ